MTNTYSFCQHIRGCLKGRLRDNNNLSHKQNLYNQNIGQPFCTLYRKKNKVNVLKGTIKSGILSSLSTTKHCCLLSKIGCQNN